MFSQEILLELPSNSLGPSVVRTAPWWRAHLLASPWWYLKWTFQGQCEAKLITFNRQHCEACEACGFRVSDGICQCFFIFFLGRRERRNMESGAQEKNHAPLPVRCNGGRWGLGRAIPLARVWSGGGWQPATCERCGDLPSVPDRWQSTSDQEKRRKTVAAGGILESDQMTATMCATIGMVRKVVFMHVSVGVPEVDSSSSLSTLFQFQPAVSQCSSWRTVQPGPNHQAPSMASASETQQPKEMQSETSKCPFSRIQTHVSRHFW